MKNNCFIFFKKGGRIFLPFFILMLVILPIVVATNLDIPLPTALGNSYGTFKQGSNITLLQTCTNLTTFCDECNLTSLKFDGDELIAVNVAMTRNAALFNYTLEGAYTQESGHYTVTGFCVGGEIFSPFAYTFEITPSGLIYSSSFIWIILALAFGTVILGWWKDDYAITVLGSMGAVFVGQNLLFYGIDGIKNDMTNAISIIILAIFGYIMVKLGLDWIQGEYR